jgi:hydrogenase maturation protease
MTKPKWLVFGIGNPSRGDDALGSTLIERLEEWLEDDFVRQALPMDVITHTDFQCQIEHALDLVGVETAIFADASVACEPPFEFVQITAQQDASHSTHALTPPCVLAVAQQLGQTLPQTWTLALRGKSFELGEPLSAEAADHLEQAFIRLTGCLREGRVE